jgi:azurin
MTRTTLAVTVLFAAGLLAGCGGQQERALDESLPEAMRAFSDDGNVVELTIEGDDLMQFDKKRLAARPGQMVRLTLRHTGKLPAQAMGHNVVILKKGEDVFEFGADVGERGGTLENDYLPEPLWDRVVAFTEMVGGGETTTVRFRAPGEPGEYPFLCSFPGHFGQMNGIFAVEG